MYVETSGTREAPTIIFLHGVGTSGWMWWLQTAALRDFHCVNVDLPGHGKSNHITWHSLTDTAQQVAEIIRTRANGGRAHVVGLSLGGYVGLKLLEHHAELVVRAVLSGVTASPMPNRIFLRPQLALMTLMRRRWIVNMQAKSLNLPSHMEEAYTENLLAMSMKTYRRIMEEAVEFVVPHALETAHTPTLIVAGGDEPDIILQSLTAIPALMPGAQSFIAPDVGHGWNVEAPDLFSEMIRAWICDTPLPAQLQPVAT